MGISAGLGTAGLQPAVCTSTTRPAAPYEGQMIFETDTNRLVLYNGSSWVYIVDTDTPPGLELVKTQTVGSGVSSVTVSDAFSSSFDNYRITIASVDASTSDQVSLLTFGSTATGYYGSVTLQSYGSASPTILNRNNAASLYLIASDTEATHFMSFDVYSPNLAQRTGISGTGFGYTYTSWFGGFVANTTAYTSFTITSGSGTMTGGTISVYGYRK
jgi:hypothetical protein